MHGSNHTISKDNLWNTLWYYQKPVSGTVATNKLQMVRMVRTWDAILRAYLEEIGAIDWL